MSGLQRRAALLLEVRSGAVLACELSALDTHTHESSKSQQSEVSFTPLGKVPRGSVADGQSEAYTVVVS